MPKAHLFHGWDFRAYNPNWQNVQNTAATVSVKEAAEFL